jgi:hypothetical protein
MVMRAMSWWRPICAPDATTTPHAPAGCSRCSPLPPREKPAPERRCIAKSVGSPMGGWGLHARAEHAPPAVAQTAQPRPSGVLTGQWSSAQCSRVWSSGRWCAVSAVVPPPPTARGEGWRLSRHVIGGSTPAHPVSADIASARSVMGGVTGGCLLVSSGTGMLPSQHRLWCCRNGQTKAWLWGSSSELWTADMEVGQLRYQTLWLHISCHPSIHMCHGGAYGWGGAREWGG